MGVPVRLGLYWRLWKNFKDQYRYYAYLLTRKQAHRIREMLRAGAVPRPGSYFPSRLNLRLLYRCNLSCAMCGQWGRTGSYFGYDSARRRSVLDARVINTVLDALTPHGLRVVDMVGGETLLYPAFGSLLQEMRQRRLYTKFATNGTFLERAAADIVRARVASVTVSMDGDRETHNRIRGGDWIYDKTMQGLRVLRETRETLGLHTPLVQVAYTVSRHNGAAPLRRLCAELKGKGLADVLEIKLTPIVVPGRAYRRYLEVVREYFGVREGVVSPGGFTEDYGDFGPEARELARTVAELKKESFDFFIEPLPHLPPDQVPRLFTDFDWDLGRGPCPVPYDEPTIDADGNVYPCNLFTDPPLSMGNVYETPILDIWHGSKFTRFRTMIHDQGGLLPLCNRCCQLTEY